MIRLKATFGTALYRLRSDSRTGLNPFSHTYDPDLAGNPVTVNGQPFATFDDANKIATIAGGSASHDGDGNLTSISGTNVPAGTFTWDDLSRMTGYTAGGIARTYGYHASGTRVWSQAGANPKKFYIFDGDLLLGEVDSATNTVTAANTWGANGLISQRIPQGSFWYHFGPQGETRQLTNASGAITDSYFYAPYGVQIASTGTTPNPFRYGGQVGYYSEGDLYLCGARWYNPFLGRWLSRDPIGYEGGPNLYAYVGQNPVTKVDPSGLSPDDHFIDDAITGFWTVVGGITGGTLGGGGGAAVGVPTGPGAAATSVAGMVKGAAAGSAMGYAFGRWMVGLRHYGSAVKPVAAPEAVRARVAGAARDHARASSTKEN